MHPTSLKTRILLAVAALVVGSGLLIAVIVGQRYSASLWTMATAQAENLGHALALEAADKVLTNDLVGLQKMLDHQQQSSPMVSYLFVHRQGQILAHTFKGGIPAGLPGANGLTPEGKPGTKTIASTSGERFLDIAWPIFAGKAGVLRLGMSEAPVRQQLRQLWLKMALVTLAVLAAALGASLLFVKRLTSPLADLVDAAKRVDAGERHVQVAVRGAQELRTLATAFNQMVAKMEDYTSRLEEQTEELERAHHRTRTFCNIVREIGARQNLQEIASFLLHRFRAMLTCDELTLLVVNEHCNLLCTFGQEVFQVLEDNAHLEKALAAFQQSQEARTWEPPLFAEPLVPAAIAQAAKQTVIPFRHPSGVHGGLVAACSPGCDCAQEQATMAGLVLAQAAGVIRRALRQEEESRELRRRVESCAGFSGIIGKDPKMQAIYKLIEDTAPTDVTVLIQGESGTGKELVARALHWHSPRRDQRFVVINCAAYPATLLESELFGHEKGAFTGAVRRKAGRFEQAHGGTVFLDEIGEIPLSAQIKLLRVLQTRKFERLGGHNTVEVDVRIVAATNKDLLAEVKAGRFREDLYYRLNVIPIHLPPLRQRRNDIPLLAHCFMERFAQEQGKTLRGFRSEALRLLLEYSWPGNVRELENSIEHAVVLAKGDTIEPGDLPAPLRDATPRDLLQEESKSAIAAQEKRLILEVLEACGWNKKQAATRLGISRSTLYAKLKKYQLRPPTRH